MIFSTQSLLSDAQAVTATAASTNQIDLKASGTVYGAAAALNRDIGKGKKIPVLVQVVEAFNNLTSLTVTWETDDDVAFGSPKIVGSSRVVALADLVLGFQFETDTIPIKSAERYIRLKYTVAGTAPTLGKITAAVSMGNQTN